VREELGSRNVAALVEISTPRARRTLVWTVDQSRQLLENACDENDPYYVAYVLMLVLGLRRGELGLGWDDVDLAAGKVIIAWQLQRVRGQLLWRPTKIAASDAALPSHGSVSRRWNRAAIPNGSCQGASMARVAYCRDPLPLGPLSTHVTSIARLSQLLHLPTLRA
jgi:integrase